MQQFMVKLFLLCSVYLLATIVLLQATLDDSTDSDVTYDLKSVVETLRGIESSIKILLSESNLQNQDLEILKDDVSDLKFGFAVLTAQSDQQYSSLREEIGETQDCLEDFRNDADRNFDNVQTEITEIRECLETAKNETADNLISLQRDVSDIEVCVETTKNNTETIINTLIPIGTRMDRPATSCSEVLQAGPELSSGLYWLRGTDDTVNQVFCDMELVCPDETEPTGWMRVASINMNDSTQTCPPGIVELTNDIRRCSKFAQCASTTFSVQAIQYSQVCGMARGYQDGSTEAFSLSRISGVTIDGIYVDGISLTYDQNPRKHIWTFASGLNRDPNTEFVRFQCPCTSPDRTGQTFPPDFVGNDYFCESASDTSSTASLFTDNPLWDGEGCVASSDCCGTNNPLWFRKEISPPTSENIEMRLCTDSFSSDGENINFDMFELYIQ